MTSLSGESSSREIDDGSREEDRHLGHSFILEESSNGEESRLRVGRVEDRLHEKEVGAALEQVAGLVAVRLHQLLESCMGRE